jgi:ABC-type glycerol-3-phosphate transport system permease component
MIFITLMLPVEVRILPTYQVAANLELIDTYAGLTLPLIASATATFLFRQFFLTIPDEYAEAARIDGAGPLGIALRLKLPLMRKWIAYMAILSFATGTQLFVEPQLVNQASLGMVPDTWSSNQLAYQTAFRYADFNGAAAIAVDLLAIGLVAAVIIVTRTGLFRRDD